jgi:hypothetical protein
MMGGRETESVYMTFCCKVKPLKITAKTLPKQIWLETYKNSGLADTSTLLH